MSHPFLKQIQNLRNGTNVHGNGRKGLGGGGGEMWTMRKGQDKELHVEAWLYRSSWQNNLDSVLQTCAYAIAWHYHSNIINWVSTAFTILCICTLSVHWDTSERLAHVRNRTDVVSRLCLDINSTMPEWFQHLIRCWNHSGIVVFMSRHKQASPVQVGSILQVCQSHLAGLCGELPYWHASHYLVLSTVCLHGDRGN